MEQPNKTHPFGTPGAFAIARNQANNDIATGVLLYRLKWYWRPAWDGKRLKRLDREWIAMSRIRWAREAGLSDGEMKNRALPRLRKLQFVEARQMKLAGVKLLWLSLDLATLSEFTNDLETSDELLNGAKYPGYHKTPTNPYKAPK